MGTRSTNDPFYQELGKALKKARLTADITPSQAAASADLSSSNVIGRYENATRTPDIKTFAALSTAYSVEPQSLIQQAQAAAQQIKKGNNVKNEDEKEN